MENAIPLNWFRSLAAIVVLGTGSAADASSLQEVLARGEIRVGVTVAAPWVMRDEEGQYSGFEIDVARRLAADLGVEVAFRRYEFGELIRALEGDEIDLIAAGLTISPERALHVNFSQPYAIGGIGIATNLASTADVGRLEDLDNPEFTIAVLDRSVAAELARRVLPSARLETFATEDDAAAALIAGDVDIYLDQEPIPTFLALAHPDVIDVPVNRPLLETRSAFAVGKGDPDFLAFLNAWIEAREADTWLPTTHRYWFRSLQWSD
jgi:polar amino acid transport system substrate-binding protein